MVTKMKNFLKFKTGEKAHDLRKFGEEYYLREAKLWRPFRLSGIIATLLALILLMVAILSEDWAHSDVVQGYRISMWTYCYTMNMVNGTVPVCSGNWQNAVIGLMLFAAGFGFVAAVLAVLGVCTSPLPKKIYYFHSAGEIFFVCALSTTVALTIYPIEMNNIYSSYTYGSGYGLGWGGTVFLFAASFCMSLDDLVRCISTNKCCRWCWKQRTTDRTELQQV